MYVLVFMFHCACHFPYPAFLAAFAIFLLFLNALALFTLTTIMPSVIALKGETFS
jgi:hypothetical protein